METFDLEGIYNDKPVMPGGCEVLCQTRVEVIAHIELTGTSYIRIGTYRPHLKFSCCVLVCVCVCVVGTGGLTVGPCGSKGQWTEKSSPEHNVFV